MSWYRIPLSCPEVAAGSREQILRSLERLWTQRRVCEPFAVFEAGAISFGQCELFLSPNCADFATALIEELGAQRCAPPPANARISFARIPTWGAAQGERQRITAARPLLDGALPT